MASLRDHLQAIYEEHGKLTPELVVAAARPSDHPLHDRVFDRPTADAAEAWYRQRAHELIQSVRVVYRPSDSSDERSVRAFCAVRATDDEFVYEPVEKVVQNEFLRNLVLQEMERDWKALLRRYEMFDEFAKLVLADVTAA